MVACGGRPATQYWRWMVARKDVVFLEAGGTAGTGFLITSGLMVTALHVVSELDQKHLVVTDAGRPQPMGPISCTYFSEGRKHWTEVIEFDPSRDAYSIAEDWVVLRVSDAAGVRVWDCDKAQDVDRGAECWAYGFPATHGDVGVQFHGELTGLRDPLVPGVSIHRAWIKEAIGWTGQSPQGFSGGPVVVGHRVIGIVSSFANAGEDLARGAVVNITPIEAVLETAGIDKWQTSRSVDVNTQLFEGPQQVPARLVPHFRGRDDELAELEQLLLGDNRTVCVVATGIGGIGKTTLVEEFVATRAPVLFPDGAAWLDGSQLVSELGRVSRRFGWVDDREPTPAEAIGLLGRALHTKRVLLVVDNFAPDPEHGDLGHVPAPGGECRTLVTSRSRTVNVQLNAAALELGVWTIEACRDYLRERCPRLGVVPDAEIDALAEFVGRLPLGVRLLVSVLSQRRSLSPAAALNLLEAQSLGVLDKYDADRGIAATFQFSYDALTDDGRRVLQALAVSAKQTRPEVVEAVAGVGDPREVLDDLHARGLAEFSAEAHATWGLHDVVRMFVVAQPGREEFESAHTGWVETHLNENSDATAHLAFAAGVDEASCAFERLLSTDIELADSIYRPLENHLTVVGRYPEAVALSDRLLRAAPSGSTLAASALGNLGLCYRTLGDIPKAIDFIERSLAI
ncbi:trypsin-like serine protease, partial [Enhygromyxa salina]|uniref:trypsin-like serine protease n=1 Tax=Enhygromyxa salina TaxID=215803 RepID=UPI0023E3C700